MQVLAAAIVWVVAFALVTDKLLILVVFAVVFAAGSVLVGRFGRKAIFGLLRNLTFAAFAILLMFVSQQLQSRHNEEFVKAVAGYESSLAKFEVLETPRELRRVTFATNPNRHMAEIRISSFGDISNLSEYGELSFTGQLQPHHSYSAQLQLAPARSGERAIFRATSSGDFELINTVAEPLPFANFFIKLRETYLQSIGGVNQDATALVAGLAIGGDHGLSDDTKSSMRTVSLTHLTAVSGANCAIVIATFFFLTRRLRVHSRVIASISALVAYVALVGAEPSVLRSATMATAVLIGIGLGRRVLPLAALAVAVVVLLIADPWLSTDFGFALSVLATAGILELAPFIYLKLKPHMANWLAMGVSVSLAAQLFCLPVLLQLQPGLATYSIAANLLAEPLVAPVTILGITGVLVTVIAPWLTYALSWVASIATYVIISISDFLARLPVATLPWAPGLLGLLAAIVLICAVLIFTRAQTVRNRNLALLIVCGLLATTLSTLSDQVVRNAVWPPSDWQVANCDVGQGDALVIRSQGQIAVIDVGKDDKLIDSCLNRLSINRVDLLVLTHFDFDHVGGVSGAISKRRLVTTLVTSFVDDRPEAKFVRTIISNNSSNVYEAEVGMTGKLGDLSWHVLSPHHLAIEADDSNDASTTMLFTGPDFYLLALADLGEKGQMRLASEKETWFGVGLDDRPLIMKVSHHGSADQYPELLEAVRPDLALISVGANNGYGHPTDRTLKLLQSAKAVIGRTDLNGALAVSVRQSKLSLIASG